MPQAKLIIDHIMEEATFYNRIYVASIHQDLAAADLQRWICMDFHFCFIYISIDHRHLEVYKHSL